MATSVSNFYMTACQPFNVEIETITEFIERFKVQAMDLLLKAGADPLAKSAVLIKFLPVNVITDLQRKIKPTLLSAAKYDDLINTLTGQFSVKKSIVGASVQFLNRKQGNETIEVYAKDLNELASHCEYQDCCRDRLLRDAFISGLSSPKY